MQNSQLVYLITSYIPVGKVLTYKALAKIAGIKNPRLVGSILHHNPDQKKIPCHRVVNSVGKLAANYAFGGKDEQHRLLKLEGVRFENMTVDLSQSLWKPSKLLTLYFELLKKYDEPGPWPWFSDAPAHTIEEIIIGAILTQNTNWRNVSYALDNLKTAGVCTIKEIYSLGLGDCGKLKELIKPCGFYNQKAKYLFGFSRLVVEQFKSLELLQNKSLKEVRDILLDINGVGKETADTILLYAFSKSVFVVDAYTKKFVIAHNLTSRLDYDSLQEYFTKELPQNIDLYKDYHALIVRWGKEKGIVELEK